jgi:hypothetical protein
MSRTDAKGQIPDLRLGRVSGWATAILRLPFSESSRARDTDGGVDFLTVNCEPFIVNCVTRITYTRGSTGYPSLAIRLSSRSRAHVAWRISISSS